jgi:hypothetical protein
VKGEKSTSNTDRYSVLTVYMTSRASLPITLLPLLRPRLLPVAGVLHEQIRCNRGQELLEQKIGISWTVGQSGVNYLTRILHEHACAIYPEGGTITVVLKWRYMIG